ncbi:hypothetical protein BCR34DRAFT_588270 [Clohesyomyces aquaticus]|uniref:Uncharacterized protein n=1 Tax=Clohesyomyces aquaticus TaxID=1231657 RepID=A0A1Y1ZLD8_9PLEO|nr:hypothetical protein BCR34DRAFT_588270 [Clohesyomyces aquaticus]
MSSGNGTQPSTSIILLVPSSSPPSSASPTAASASPTGPSIASTPTPAPSSATPAEPSSAASSPEPPSSSNAPVTLTSSAPPPPSSTPAPPPSSTPAPPPSSASQAPPATSVVTASSRPPSTQIITSFITPSASIPGQTPSVIVITSVITNEQPQQSSIGTRSGSAAPSSSTPASLQGNEGKSKSNGGLTDAGRTAIAVVIPVVVVALLVLAGLFLWKKRKARKHAEEARRKEVEEYGFNPNHDPTLPAVGMANEMTEDHSSGYRGWGNTSTTRKASTTLTSGLTYSDPGSNPGGYVSPGSPTAAHSDGHSNDPLVNGRRETLDSEGIAALGTGPGAGQNRSDIHRGPSNASSSYSAANRSDNSGEYPIPVNNPQDYYDNYQPGPYGDPYTGAQQPVIRDVSARRNTRIENPSVFPQQGNSGIAQNF